MTETNMTRDEFIQEIMDVANEYGEAVVQEVEKPNMHYTGILIKQTGVPSPVINVDALYNNYDIGKMTLTECQEFARGILNRKIDDPFLFDIKQIRKWEIAKDYLYLKLVGKEPGSIYKEVGDMFLVPYIRLTADDTATTRVIPQFLGDWGIDEEAVFEQAKRNQEIIRPIKMMDLGEKLGFPFKVGSYIITTETEINGASAIFYDGVFDKLKEIFGEFYLLPSSIHEMLAIPKEGASVADLRATVSRINATSVDEVERLTNSVYTYDFENNVLRKVD